MLKRLLQSLSQKFSPRSSASASRLRVVEIEDAVTIAGELFSRIFKQPIPDFPRHFVLVWEPPGVAPQTLGYVHHTSFEGAYLAGGLVVDAWLFRKMDRAAQEAVHTRGGLAQWLMTESCRMLQPCQAVYAYIGDSKSLTVNKRVGFREAKPPYLYILQPRPKDATVEALTDRVAALGPF